MQRRFSKPIILIGGRSSDVRSHLRSPWPSYVYLHLPGNFTHPYRLPGEGLKVMFLGDSMKLDAQRALYDPNNSD